MARSSWASSLSLCCATARNSARNAVGFVRRLAAGAEEASELPRGVESGARVVDVIDVMMEHIPRGLRKRQPGSTLKLRYRMPLLVSRCAASTNSASRTSGGTHEYTRAQR
jgi:hypothetical protein